MQIESLLQYKLDSSVELNMLPLSLSSVAQFLNQNVPSSNTVLGVAVDSRKVNPGDLFFALPGAKDDGHSFLEEVSRKGASGLVVKENYAGDNFGLPLIKVPDVLQALHELGRRHLKHHNPKIVGITGSLGKTTTKEFIHTLLKKRFNVEATPGNANSKIGIPLSLLNMKEKSDILIVEMGMSEPGDISNLLNVVVPDIAVITTVALVHACHFDSLESIADGKGELFSHEKTTVGLYNASMPFAQKIKGLGSCVKKSFSLHNSEADYYIEHRENEAHLYFQGASVAIIPWNIMGNHNLQNFLAAVGVARELGMSFEEIKEASHSLKLPPKRLERIEKDGITFINDAYNANENSMCAALSSLPTPKDGGRKIAVLGDMKELGKYSDQAHKLVAEYALKHVDLLFCTGNDCRIMEEVWKRAKKQVYHFDAKENLVQKLKETMNAGDVVLLKGSRAHALDSITEEL